MGPWRPNNSSNRKPVNTGGRMMGRCTKPSKVKRPGKRRDNAKAQAIASGSDQSKAKKATLKLVPSTSSSRADNITRPPAAGHRPSRPPQERENPPADGSGHWRRRKPKLARSPDHHRRARVVGPGGPRPTRRANNVRAAHWREAHASGGPGP